MVAALPSEEKERFERIFSLCITVGRTVPPQPMHDWIVSQFGSVDAVRQQCIVKVTNRVTLEGALFNDLRARRPFDAPAGADNLEELIATSRGGPFCHPLEGTPADIFGRIRGQYAVTAANVAKYDGWHAVIVFDEHHPLRFTAERVADYLDTAQRWARTASSVDPEACYPFILWNCLWKSGASILHGHAQITLTRGMHYAQVERWRQAAQRYQAVYGTDYFADLVSVHRALDLAVDYGGSTVLPSLTPFKEKETLIIAQDLEGAKSAVFLVLHAFVATLGVQSFNLGIYLPPLATTPEDWTGFPLVVRILDRGSLAVNTADIGAMELFAQSVVTTDPFSVADALRVAASLGAKAGKDRKVHLRWGERP